MTPKSLTRPLTRREKTRIRQDSKRFQKIGRDHGCILLEEFAEFVHERLRRNGDGYLTGKSQDYARGLGVYFGDCLRNETSMIRVAVDPIGPLDDPVIKRVIEHQPGWLMRDTYYAQWVLIPVVINERLLSGSRRHDSLDDVLDQLVDWNLGYLSQDDLSTRATLGVDLEPDLYSVA